MSRASMWGVRSVVVGAWIAAAALAAIGLRLCWIASGPKQVGVGLFVVFLGYRVALGAVAALRHFNDLAAKAAAENRNGDHI